MPEYCYQIGNDFYLTPQAYEALKHELARPVTGYLYPPSLGGIRIFRLPPYYHTPESPEASVPSYLRLLYRIVTHSRDRTMESLILRVSLWLAERSK